MEPLRVNITIPKWRLSIVSVVAHVAAFIPSEWARGVVVNSCAGFVMAGTTFSRA